MRQRRPILSFAFTFLTALSLASGVGVCWSHPPAKSPGKQARDMLSSADEVRVEVIVVGYPNGDEVVTYSAKLNPADLKPIIEDFGLGAKREKFSWGTDVTPIIYLTFFEKRKEVGTLSVGYGHYTFDYFMPPIRSDFPQYHLDIATVRQLRCMIAHNKTVVKALHDAGVIDEEIDPGRIAPIKNAD